MPPFTFDTAELAKRPQQPGLPQIPRGPVVPPGRYSDPRFHGKTGKPIRRGLQVGETVLGPERVAEDTQKLYQLLSSSPAFASLLQGIMRQGQTAQTGIASALGRTGLSGSGIGATVSGLGQTIGQTGASQARGSLFANALQQAIANLSQQLQAGAQYAQLYGAGK